MPTMPPVPQFPLASFPAPVADYWRAAADALSVPVDCVAVPAIPLLGAAIGRSMAVEIKKGYQESPILWTGLVARPGDTKSESLKRAAGPLHRIAAEWATCHREEQKRFNRAMHVFDQALKEWKKDGIGDPPDAPEPPTCRQLVYDDFTSAALVRGNAENPRGIVVAKDELVSLITAMNQFTGGKGDDRQKLLAMWSGGAVIVNREKDRAAGRPPVALDHSFLGVTGMIQPDMLSVLRGDAGRDDYVNDGWADRFLLSFPDYQPATGETGAIVPEDLTAGYDRIFRDILGWPMEEITQYSGDVALCPRVFSLDDSGWTVWKDYTAAIADRMNALEPDDHYRGFLSKHKHHTVRMTALIHGLQMACGEVDGQSKVSGETMGRAIAVTKYFEPHVCRCLGIGWQDRRAKIARRLLNWLARVPYIVQFTRTEAFQQIKQKSASGVQKSAQLNTAFEMLVDLGYLRLVTGGPPKSGPAGERYAANPLWDRTDF